MESQKKKLFVCRHAVFVFLRGGSKDDDEDDDEEDDEDEGDGGGSGSLLNHSGLSSLSYL